MTSPATPYDDRLTPGATHLLDFARASAAPPLGFAWLDDTGRPDPSQPIHTWIPPG